MRVNEDTEVLSIRHLGNKPNTIYFFPVITFIVLFYFNRVDIDLDKGYISAMLGISLISTLVQTAFVGFGLLTDEWYSLKARSSSIFGEILIGVISLFSSQFTFFVIGYATNWFPDWGNVKWFIWGFIIYQMMWIGFTYFYAEKGGFTKDNRVNVFLGMLVSITLGIIGVYAVIGV